MFKKRKKGLFSAIDDNRTITYSFRLRSSIYGCESYCPADYVLYHRLEENEMLPALDKHLNVLFAGNIDEHNENVVDSYIMASAHEALQNLELQRANHRDIIRRLAIRHEADHRDLENMKKAREDEYEELKAECERILDLIKEREEV